MEELHAAAFHFQHGPTEVARSYLQRARSFAPERPDATSTALLAQLGQISQRIDTDPNWAQSEAEYFRVAFGDWICVTESLHQHFHEKLPRTR